MHVFLLQKNKLHFSSIDLIKKLTFSQFKVRVVLKKVTLIALKFFEIFSNGACGIFNEHKKVLQFYFSDFKQIKMQEDDEAIYIAKCANHIRTRISTPHSESKSLISSQLNIAAPVRFRNSQSIQTTQKDTKIFSSSVSYLVTIWPNCNIIPSFLYQ